MNAANPTASQGETEKLCDWTVDLSVLPSFQHNAQEPSPNGFYTGTAAALFLPGVARVLTVRVEFELGLELDSAEVRGVLVHEGQDWGQISFEYRT